MQIVAALFLENINFRREYDGGPTLIDITGAYFSTRVESYPATLTPHMSVLLRAEDDASRQGTLEIEFVRVDGEETEAGRFRTPVSIAPPGTFFNQLVRPELTFDGPGTIEARCRIAGTDALTTVPLSLLA